MRRNITPRWQTLAVAVLACAGLSAQAQEPVRDRARQLDQLNHWMAHYYESPAPDEFVGWVRSVAREGLLAKPSSRLPVMIFMSEVLRQNPERAAQWCKDLAFLPQSDKPHVAWTFRNAAVPGFEACVQKDMGLLPSEADKVLASGRFDLMARQPASAAELDMLWVTFMATGRDEPVNRIIEVLARPEPERTDPGGAQALLLRGAASWSLASNARQHPRVRELVAARRSIATGSLRKGLDEVWARIQAPAPAAAR